MTEGLRREALREGHEDGGAASLSAHGHEERTTMPTEIEWTDETWQVTTGCARVSPECGTHEGGCYAERMAKRLQKIPSSAEKYRNGFEFTFHYKEFLKDLENEPEE